MHPRIVIDAPRASGDDIDDAFVACLREALGCTNEPMARSTEIVTGASPEDRIPHAASSADRVTVRTWRIESPRCRIDVERTYTFFPGDVNEAPSANERVRATGTKVGGPTATLRTRIGSHEVTLEVDAEDTERDAIVACARRAFETTP